MAQELIAGPSVQFEGFGESNTGLKIKAARLTAKVESLAMGSRSGEFAPAANNRQRHGLLWLMFELIAYPNPVYDEQVRASGFDPLPPDEEFVQKVRDEVEAFISTHPTPIGDYGRPMGSTRVSFRRALRPLNEVNPREDLL